MLSLETSSQQVRKSRATFLSKTKRKAPIIIKANCLEIALRTNNSWLHLSLKIVTNDWVIALLEVSPPIFCLCKWEKYDIFDCILWCITLKLFVLWLDFHPVHFFVNPFKKNSQELLGILLCTSCKSILSAIHMTLKLRRIDHFLIPTVAISVQYPAIRCSKALFHFLQFHFFFESWVEFFQSH